MLYLSPGESREEQRINGYITNKDLWKKILEANDCRFTASSLATNNEKYNDAAKGRMIRDGGIEKTSNGKDISKNCENIRLIRC